MSDSFGKRRWPAVVGLAVAGTIGAALLSRLPSEVAPRSAAPIPLVVEGSRADVPRDLTPAGAPETVEPAASTADEAARAALTALTRGLRGLAKLEGASIDEAIAAALDPGAGLDVRVAAVRRLASLGTDEAIRVLEHLLHSQAPASLKAAIAVALGSAPHPEARGLLDALLESDDAEIVRGALRGIAASGDPADAELLVAFVRDPVYSDAVRAQAAESLASLDSLAAAGLLRELLPLENDELAAGLLEGLGQRPFEETGEVFQSVLADPTRSEDLKVSALEALSQSTPDAASLLLSYARGAPEPQLRIAAVETLSLLDDDPALPGALAEFLHEEPLPEVRSELYRALSMYPGEMAGRSDPGALVELVVNETTPEARLHAYRLVASMVREQPDAEIAETFDSVMVPWLSEQALDEADHFTRSVSLDTLKLAGTPGATEALLDLTHSHEPEIVAAAEDALLFPRPAR